MNIADYMSAMGKSGPLQVSSKALGYGSAALLGAISAVAFAAIIPAAFNLLPAALTISNLLMIGGAFAFGAIALGILTYFVFSRSPKVPINPPIHDAFNALDETFTEALETAVGSDQPSISSTSTSVPFHTIFSHNGAKILLGNNRTWELMAEHQSRDISTFKDKYEKIDDEKAATQTAKELNEVTTIDFLLSLNEVVSDEQVPETSSPLIIDGLSSQQPSITFTEALKPENLETIFSAIDRNLNDGKTVMLQCDQGDDQSAAVLVRYLMDKTGHSFEDAYQFVSSKREIKPYNDGDATLMTRAYQQQLPGAKPRVDSVAEYVPYYSDCD